MEAFGMIALLGLAALIVSRISVRYLEMAREFVAVGYVVLGSRPRGSPTSTCSPRGDCTSATMRSASCSPA